MHENSSIIQTPSLREVIATLYLEKIVDSQGPDNISAVIVSLGNRAGHVGALLQQGMNLVHRHGVCPHKVEHQLKGRVLLVYLFTLTGLLQLKEDMSCFNI